ncbi:hypothetical protein ACFLUQ_02215 [Chloroflexota bacterium]
MNLPLLSMTGYIVITSLIAVLGGRRGRGVREFLVAGADLRWLLILPFLLGEFVTTSAVVGVAEMAHELGVIAPINYLGATIATVILMFGLAQFFVLTKKTTIGEVFALLFDQKTRLACVITLLVTQLLTTPIAFLSFGAVLAPVLNIPYEWSVWLTAAVIVAIAVTGGVRGVAWMNVVHMIVMFICLGIVAVVSVNTVGGLSNLFASLPSEHLNILRVGGFTVGAWTIGAIAARLISLTTIVAMLAAKDEKKCQNRGIIVGAASSCIRLFADGNRFISIYSYA